MGSVCGRSRYLTLILMVACLGTFLPVAVAHAGGDDSLRAVFINVGQGDSAWLHLPDGTNILVDGGGSWAGPTVVAYLNSHGITHIDLLVATHGDADHIGGLPRVLDSISVTEAWLDSQTCTTSVCLGFYQALADHGVVTSTVRMGESYTWGAVTATVLNPSEPLYQSKNENSVVVRFSYGSVDFLLTGDAEDGAEGRMIRSGLPLDAEILKVSHHGSNSSSTIAFLTGVRPQQAIISVGPNPYGLPHPDTLSRLAAVGANIHRTDLEGNITVFSDGNTYWFGDQTVVFLPLTLRSVGPPTPTATPTWTPVATATATMTPTPTATPTGQSGLRIRELQYSGRDEWVRIHNYGIMAQDMTDWQLMSVVGSQTYDFPAEYTLAAGGSVYVHSGPDAYQSLPSHLRWTGRYVWNNDGDEARLYDADGHEVDRWSY